MEWEGDKGPPINLAWGPRRLNPALNIGLHVVELSLYIIITACSDDNLPVWLQLLAFVCRPMHVCT